MNKLALHQKCLEIVENSILSMKMALQQAQEAANNETKSSAGDKHETGRAMAQLETEKLSAQLNDALNLKQVIAKINPPQQTINSLPLRGLGWEQITIGSLVYTTNGIFYVAVSLGKIDINNETIYVVSPQSPIGKLLLTKKEKDSFSLNGKIYLVEKIV
jgi:transcription elongation GreA/GreB family factor